MLLIFLKKRKFCLGKWTESVPKMTGHHKYGSFEKYKRSRVKMILMVFQKKILVWAKWTNFLYY